MEWLYYLLEANLYLLLFYAFYKLFLHNETFYNTNRYYILLASITAFVLPILQLGFLKPSLTIDNAALTTPVVHQNTTMLQLAATQTGTTTDYSTYCYAIYLAIVLGLALKLILSLVKIVRLWFKAKKTTAGKITVVELNDQKTAFSFFNLLFIHPQLAEKETVFTHEMIHIKQKHSIDILFFEILQVICWFNQIIYFIKNDIKLLHEYIADELSTKSGMHKHEYALFLITNSFGVVPTPLTNQIFNQSILKRRINMLNKKRTAIWARLRLLLVLPLTGGMLCLSTMAFTKSYGYVNLLPEKSKAALTLVQEVPQTKQQEQVKFPPPKVAKKKANEFIPLYTKNDATNEFVYNDKRYIVINGKAIKDFNQFYGVYNADKVMYLAKKDALAKYGQLAKNGAVEITGKQIKYHEQLVILNPPPAIQPPPPGYKPKSNQIKPPPPVVKFPPPVVKPNIPTTKTAPTDQEEEKVVQGYATKAKETITVQGYPLNASRKKTEPVTVQGYATKGKDEIVVQGYSTRPKNEITVQGYPTPAKEKKQATITVQGYRTKSNNDNGSGNQDNHATTVTGINSAHPAGNATTEKVTEVKISAATTTVPIKVRGIEIEATNNSKAPVNKVMGIKIKPTNATSPLNKVETIQIVPSKAAEKPAKNNK